MSIVNKATICISILSSIFILLLYKNGLFPNNESIKSSEIETRRLTSSVFWRSNGVTGENTFDFDPLTCYNMVWKPTGNNNNKKNNAAFALALTKMSVSYVHEVTDQIQNIRRVSDHDIVVIILRSGTNARTIKHLQDRVDRNFKGVRIIETDMGFKISDLADSFVGYQETNKNCCGIEEYVKLEAFKLPYDRVLFLDLDATPIKSPDIFFNCDADFMFAAGPSSPLNAGMFVLKPSEERYNHMIETLKRVSHTFTNEFCFDGLGCGPCIRGYLCAGAEGPQGFLHYYFVKRQDESLKTHQISTCLFDYLSDPHHVCKEEKHHSYPFVNHKDNHHMLKNLKEEIILYVPEEKICRPDFWILGSRKFGTKVLYLLMSQHHQVSSLLNHKLFNNVQSYKNPIYKNIKQGTVDYLTMSPRTLVESCGRKYTKYIVLLRDPIQQCHSIMLERASLGTHNVDMNSNITEFVLNDLEKFRKIITDTKWAKSIYPTTEIDDSNCIFMGIYVVFLKRWFYHSSETNVRIYFTEHFQKHTSEVVHDALQFIGISTEIENFSLFLDEAKDKANTDLPITQLPVHQQLTPTLRKELQQTFAPYNRMLEDVLKEKLPWKY